MKVQKNLPEHKIRQVFLINVQTLRFKSCTRISLFAIELIKIRNGFNSFVEVEKWIIFIG